jgi:hypothetical protein
LRCPGDQLDRSDTGLFSFVETKGLEVGERVNDDTQLPAGAGMDVGQA